MATQLGNKINNNTNHTSETILTSTLASLLSYTDNNHNTTTTTAAITNIGVDRDVNITSNDVPYLLITNTLDNGDRASFEGNETHRCRVIQNANASLAADWENIPETIILNAAVGFILFAIFVWLTCVAWRRSDSSDLLKTQNIINFLYGYRDPENWYVIPRFEFLRREDRHHQHDMQYPFIYVPPKLPLANPLEMFAYGGPQAVKSIDSGQSKAPVQQLRDNSKRSTSPLSDVDSNIQKHPDASTETTTTKTTLKTIKSALSDGPISSDRTQGQSSSSVGDWNTSSEAVPRRDTLNNSFFFPSILTAEQLQASYLSKKLNKFFGMFFRVTDADIIYSRGIDAYEYLLFQRHLIFIMFITTVLCIGVILPIHWIGGTSADPKVVITTSFQRSTIKNIASSSNLHWAHIVCSGLIVFTTLKVMGSYMDSTIMSREEAQISRRTLLIGNIPKEQRTRVNLSQVIHDYFPTSSIEAIQFVYDTAALVDYEMYLSATIKAKEYCLAYKRKKNSEILINRTDVNTKRVCDGYCRLCSYFYVCCCYWQCETREPGSTYYAREENLYRDKIAQACKRLVSEPTEYAFVTLRSHKHARRIMSELATLKQDMLDGRPLNSFRSIRSDRIEPAAQTLPKADLQPKTTTTTATTLASTSSSNQETNKLNKKNSTTTKASTKSKFIESSTSDTDADPLDPRNNPHVRSIRSPMRSPVSVSHDSKNQRDLIRGAQKKRDSRNLSSSSSSQEVSSESAHHRTNARRKHKSYSLGSRHSASSVVGQQQQQQQARQSRSKRLPGKLEGPLVWSVRYAPHPDNVEFEDLLNLARTSKYTIFLLHLLMIVIFIFITTPNVVLSMIERIAVLRPERARQLTGFESLMINYFSILLQIVTTAILPALIMLISRQIPYEDSSTKGHSVMWKVYAFLILMVIVMPSIGMTSAQALFESDIDPKCLFPTDNGAYYINYVISSIFLSTMLELIKPVDVLFYYFILWTGRSTAEVEGGRQFIEREFSVGMQHTGVLLIFSVVMTYSISCPLIAPVGLVYFCIKHAVDHYNLYYTYFTKKVDKDLQSTIVIFVKVALLLMLFQTTVAIYINTGTSYFSLLTQMIFWITLAALVFNCFFDCTSRSSSTGARARARYTNEFCACFYLPKVISNLLRSDAIPHGCISRKV